MLQELIPALLEEQREMRSEMQQFHVQIVRLTVLIEMQHIATRLRRCSGNSPSGHGRWQEVSSPRGTGGATARPTADRRRSDGRTVRRLSVVAAARHV